MHRRLTAYVEGTNMTRSKNKYMKTSSMVAMLCASASMSLVGCGSAFQSGNAGVAASSLSGGNTVSGTTPAPAPGSTDWQKLSMNGKLSTGRFSGMQVVTIDKVTKELVLSLPMPANPYLDGVMVDFPLAQLPGAHVHLDALPSGGSALSLRVPLAALLKGVAIGDPARLPNGDPLPAIPSGQMPSAAVSLSNIAGKNINATIYMAVATIGIFVNTPFNPLFSLSVPIRSEDKTQTWGYLTLVPAKTGHDGGFFISVQIPNDIAIIIDNNL
jgi:hypothetical protein